jgi:hypothetical protein
MKKYYLIKEEKVFVSQHGEVEIGGIKKRVEFTDRYNDLDLSKIYDEDLEEVDDEDMEGSEDGYNSTYTFLDIMGITENRYNELKAIIRSYNKI